MKEISTSITYKTTRPLSFTLSFLRRLFLADALTLILQFFNAFAVSSCLSVTQSFSDRHGLFYHRSTAQAVELGRRRRNCRRPMDLSRAFFTDAVTFMLQFINALAVSSLSPRVSPNHGLQSILKHRETVEAAELGPQRNNYRRRLDNPADRALNRRSPEMIARVARARIR